MNNLPGYKIRVHDCDSVHYIENPIFYTYFFYMTIDFECNVQFYCQSQQQLIIFLPVGFNLLKQLETLFKQYNVLLQYEIILETVCCPQN